MAAVFRGTRGNMKVILAPDPAVWRDGRRIPPDEPADLDADLATQLLAEGTAIAISDAPWVLVVRSAIIGESIKPVGWRGQVSPATADLVVQREIGLRLPPPPDGTDDPLFPGLALHRLSLNWRGSFSEMYRLLCLEAPIVEAFEMAAEDVRPGPLRAAKFVPSRYQRDWIKKRLASPPNGIQDRGARLRAELQGFNQPVDPWTRSAVIAGYRQLGFSVSPEGPPTDYRQVALHEALCWWRNLAADALLTEILDMVRSGRWSLEAIRADDAQRGPSRLPGSWLIDPRMVLSLQLDELQPARRVPAGLPWFRDLRITDQLRGDVEAGSDYMGDQTSVRAGALGEPERLVPALLAELRLLVPSPGGFDQQQPSEPRESRPTAFRNAKTVPDFDLLEIAQEQVAAVGEFPDRSVDEWYDDAQQREDRRAKDAGRNRRKVTREAFERVNKPLIDAALPDGHKRQRGRKRKDAQR